MRIIIETTLPATVLVTKPDGGHIVFATDTPGSRAQLEDSVIELLWDVIRAQRAEDAARTAITKAEGGEK